MLTHLILVTLQSCLSSLKKDISKTRQAERTKVKEWKMISQSNDCQSFVSQGGQLSVKEGPIRGERWAHWESSSGLRGPSGSTVLFRVE